MEETNQPKTITDKWFKIIVTQALCVLIILLTITIVKFFFKGTFSKLKVWYTQNICAQTDVNEVIQEPKGEKDEV